MAIPLPINSCLSSREKILEAARQLFAEQGFGETSVDGIAEKAGVAKGTIYTHFASKDELLITILRIGTNELTTKVHELMRQARPFSDRLKDVTWVFLEYIEHNHNFHRVYSVQKEMLPALVSQAPEVRRDMFQQFKSFLSVLTIYMQEGIDSGFIRDIPAEEAAFYFPSILSSAVYYNNLRAERKNMDALAEEVFELYIHGFGKEK